MPGEWDETTGIPEVDAAINPFYKRRGLLSALSGVGGSAGPGYDDADGTDDGLSHRIADDAHTAGNRSGGPASDGGAMKPAAPYQAPGRARLSDMIGREHQMEQPAAPPSMKRKLLTALADAGPSALASAMGSAGGTVGADQRMQQGVQRRQSQMDLEKKNKRDDVNHLRDQIEAQQRTVEQQEYQHGEDQDRLRVSEEGLNSRAKLAEAAEDARSRRQTELIGSRKDLQQGKFGHDEEMEDQKQQGRMALQVERRKAQESVARIRAATAAATAGTKIPPLVGKAVDTFQDSQSRMDVMDKAYQDALRDPGNQQAMLNLLANHLGMTMGLQKGARLNQAIIEEAKRSGYLDERIEAHFGPDGYMTGVVLTPRQMSQMVNLAQDRLMEDARKVQEMEQYFGVQGHAPIRPRIPGSNGANANATQAAPGAGTGGGAGGAGAAPTHAPKTAEEYLKKRKQGAGTTGQQ